MFLFDTIFVARGGCGEAVNAPDCGSGTRGFDPLHPPQRLISLVKAVQAAFTGDVKPRASYR